MTAQQSTWSPCAPARCIHTPHVWSPTREGNDGVRPTSRVSTCGPTGVCVPTACERPQRVYRACTCGFSVSPLASVRLSLSLLIYLALCVSLSRSLSFFLSVWTYRAVRALDTYAPISSPFPCSPALSLGWTAADPRMTQPSASHPAGAARQSRDATQSGVHSELELLFPLT